MTLRILADIFPHQTKKKPRQQAGDFKNEALTPPTASAASIILTESACFVNDYQAGNFPVFLPEISENRQTETRGNAAYHGRGKHTVMERRREYITPVFRADLFSNRRHFPLCGGLVMQGGENGYGAALLESLHPAAAAGDCEESA
jgi:hypothetical protein